MVISKIYAGYKQNSELRSFSSDTNTFNLSGRTMGLQSCRCANVNFNR